MDLEAIAKPDFKKVVRLAKTGYIFPQPQKVVVYNSCA